MERFCNKSPINKSGIVRRFKIVVSDDGTHTAVNDIRYVSLSDLHLGAENSILTRLTSVSNGTVKLKADPTELSGRKVSSVVRTDGLKLVLDDGSWVCYRLSGTEPVVRAYTEARNEADMESLKRAAEQFVMS